MKTYRIRVTEYTDIEATTKEEALEKFHQGLLDLLKGGNDLDTDVTTVEEPNNKWSREFPTAILALFFALFATLSASAQAPRPVHMPTPPRPHYYAPKPIAVPMYNRMPQPFKLPVAKAVKMPTPHYR